MKIIQPLVQSWEKKTSNVPLLANLYSRFYRQVVEKEVNLARISSEDIVINIGCGAVPFTAYYIALLSGAKIWAVDHDEEAIEKAFFFVSKMNGSRSNIKLVKGEGSSFVPKKFTAAIVALQAEPKEEILDNLLKAAPPGARLVFRQANELFKNHYDLLPGGIKPTAYVSQKMQTFNRSVLFTK